MKVFAERLKELRKENNVTQDILCAKTQISQSVLSRYEADKSSPTAEVIVTLCKFFNVSADYMLGLED